MRRRSDRLTAMDVGKAGWNKAMQEPVPGNPVACLEELGIQVDYVRDDEIQGRCPAHPKNLGKLDRGGHWSVNITTGDHNCFACGFYGPFVTLVEYVRGRGREDAVDWINERGSIERARLMLEGGYIEDIAEPEVEITEADMALYVEVPEWACQNRDLDPESCDFYGVRWDEETYHWIIPIRDPWTGKLWGWQEKGEEDRYFNNYPKHMQKSLTLFGFQQLQDDETAILVESPLDVVRLHTAGFPGGVACFGDRVSQEQMDLLNEVTSRILVAMDNDDAGERSSKMLHKHWSSRFRLRFLNYGRLDVKDVGDMDDEEIAEAVKTSFSGVLARFD